MPNGDHASILDVGRLRLLHEVSLRGTIAAAARSLGLSSSAVSQQLAVLEREAGTPLLDRTPRGVRLTGAGRLLVERAGTVLELLERARADLDGLTGEASGSVAVASVASAAATFVSRAVARLRTSNPRIELRMSACEPARAVALLAAGDADIAVVDEYDYVPLAVPDYVRPLALVTEPLVVVSTPGLLAGSEAVALPALASRRWVMPPDDAACGTAVRSACRAAGFEPDVRWETDDMHLLVRAVADGHGVAVLPRLAVAGTAAVEIRALREPQLRRRISALSRTSAQGRPVVQVVLRALQAAARD
jgi:molybdate transport repressor ModE-like protein